MGLTINGAPDGSRLVGSAALNAALPGNVGEVLATLVEQASAVDLVTGTAKSICSISIPPGEYEISGIVTFLTGTATTLGQTQGGYSNVDNSVVDDVSNAAYSLPNTGATTGAVHSISTPIRRFATSSTVTRYLVCKATFGVSTLKAYGKIQVRRTN